MAWNPHTYLANASLRERPAIELLARVSLEKITIAYDMGCGTGNSTKLIADRYTDSKIIGIDNSDSMLDKAFSSGLHAQFIIADISDYFPDNKPDLIYSNAAYHWVDNHQVVFPKLANCLKDNGVLAIQMPSNFDAPSHTILKDIASEGEWASIVSDIRPRNPVHTADVYYDMLCSQFQKIDIWYTEYQQLLKGDDPVLNWMKGTTLVPYINLLEGELLNNFLNNFAQKLRVAYPIRSDGKTLFPFKRIFIVGQR